MNKQQKTQQTTVIKFVCSTEALETLSKSQLEETLNDFMLDQKTIERAIAFAEKKLRDDYVMGVLTQYFNFILNEFPLAINAEIKSLENGKVHAKRALTHDEAKDDIVYAIHDSTVEYDPKDTPANIRLKQNYLAGAIGNFTNLKIHLCKRVLEKYSHALSAQLDALTPGESK